MRAAVCAPVSRLRPARAALPVALMLVLTAAPLAARAGLFSDDEARKAAADLRAEFLQRSAADDARFAHIESGIDDLQRATRKLQDSIDRLDQAIRNLPLPALASQIDGVSQDLAKLRGQVEVQGNQIDQTQKHTKEFYLDLDTRLRAIEQDRAKAADSSDGAATTDPMAPPVPVGTTPTPPSPRETAAYNAAYKLFSAGSFPAAIKAFQGFSKSFPNSTYAPNVAFWTGMANFKLKAYGPAATALQSVVSTYPDSPKAPDALLNLSTIQLEQGDAKAAHQTLEDLLNRYPGSEAAGKAKVRLGR